MNKTILVILLVAVLGAGVLWVRNRNAAVAPATTTMEIQPTVAVTDSGPSGAMEALVSPADTSESMAQPQKVSFTVEGANFKFTPSSLKVRQGDTVEIVFRNTEGFHDFVLDEFGVRTKQINADASETVSFVADRTGTFEYYCSVGKHREMGMKGTLIVE